MPVLDFLYIIWSVFYAFAFAGIGNSSDNQDEDPETNDDLIRVTGVLAALTVLVLSPVIYLLLWGISSLRRRHVTTDANADDGAYMQMTTVISKKGTRKVEEMKASLFCRY
jgi:hypothetical protein